MKEESFAWFAGVDWGSEHHQVCLVDAQGRVERCLTAKAKRTGINAQTMDITNGSAERAPLTGADLDAGL